MSVPRHDRLLVDMVNESIEVDYNITCDEISNKHVTRIQIQVTRIQIQHVMRIRILHVNTIDLVQMRTAVNEDGGQKWTSLCPDQGCLCDEGCKKHTGN